MDTLFLVNKILALLTIISQIFVVVFIVYILFFRKKYSEILKYISYRAIKFSFVVALVATLGSLFYSNVAGFSPCVLCWYQRIFMYPAVILLGLALVKKDEKIVDYVLSLSVIGFLISIYHNYENYLVSIASSHATSCSILPGTGSSCATQYVLEFGYITIPVMAVTAFVLIVLLLGCKKMQK